MSAPADDLRALLAWQKRPMAARDLLTGDRWCADHGEAVLALLDAAQALIDDEESQEGGWGPDVTMLGPLVAAVRALTEPSP